MSSPFPRTLRALDGQSAFGTRFVLLSAVALLAVWGVWAWIAKVPVYVTSDRARLEVTRATHPVDAPLAGMVVELRLTLNDSVSEGDTLLVLDATPERHLLAEARAKITGLDAQREATKKQLAAEQQALGSFHGQLGSTVAEATSKLREAEVSTRAARDEVSRNERLHDAGAISEVEIVRARAELERRVAAEGAARSVVDRLRSESSTGAGDRRTRLATLDRDVVRLEAERASLEASINTLEHEIGRRTLRAPAAGRIGEIGSVRVGSAVTQGERIATVIAGGTLKIVAYFDPATALGRVTAGQRARVRLDGFPWTEYGALDATVAEVAAELRDGKARIELAIDERTPTRIPLQHGLPGTVEIAVEESTPASLVLRAAGRIGARSPGAAADGGAPL